MRWHRLGQVHIFVAGSQVALPDVGLDVAQTILETLRETWTPAGTATEGAPGRAG
jgi:membrane protein YdbS with pleckstrin-like domain